MTAIEWTDVTWNPTTGCDRVSPGCDHCYAMTLAKRLKGMGQAKYQTDGDPRTSGPGFGLAVHPDALTIPLRWREPRRIFVNSMSDLFHARVPREFIARVWDVMSRTPQHTYQILTKRPERMNRVVRDLPDNWWMSPLRNVWLGTSIEDQERAEQRLRHLYATPAAVRFLSCEPLLGPIDLGPWLWEDCPPECVSADHQRNGHRAPTDRLHWVITGGESGPGARPMHPDWARTLRDQCVSAGVPFFFKQWGEHAPYSPSDWSEERGGCKAVNLDGSVTWVAGDDDLDHLTNHDTNLAPDWAFANRVGKKAAGRELDGRTWDEYPAGPA